MSTGAVSAAGGETGLYEVYAIKYGHLARRSGANFLGGDSHDVDMPLDYFVWVIVGATATYVVDTGFSEATAARRSRHITAPVREGLAALGVAPESVRDVILTHLHYDHAGNCDLFPGARFHLQDREMAFCTGRHMCHGVFGHHYQAEDVAGLIMRLFEGRLAFHDGSAELAPGLRLHRVGGHTDGQQVVQVMTRRGWLVLASDASHFYANMERALPFPAVYDVGAMLEGFETLRRLADAPELIVPGHDPEVLRRFPAPRADLEGWIARLDVPPRGAAKG